jgi:hypothetical protein
LHPYCIFLVYENILMFGFSWIYLEFCKHEYLVPPSANFSILSHFLSLKHVSLANTHAQKFELAVLVEEGSRLRAL